MKENDKIYVSLYLERLNEKVDDAKRLGFKDKYIKYLSCRELANICNVTACTISNLSTNSKFSLIHKICENIYDCYFSYYQFEYQQEKKEYPDEEIYIRDISYVIYELTSYYTSEWLNL